MKGFRSHHPPSLDFSWRNVRKPAQEQTSASSTQGRLGLRLPLIDDKLLVSRLFPNRPRCRRTSGAMPRPRVGLSYGRRLGAGGRECHGNPAPPISASGRGQCRTVSRLADRLGAVLPLAGRYASLVALHPGWARHPRAADAQWLSEQLGVICHREQGLARAPTSARSSSCGRAIGGQCFHNGGVSLSPTPGATIT